MIILFLYFLTPVFGAPPINFQDLPRLVRDGNESVRGTQLESAALGERTGRLRRSFLPTVGAEVGHEMFRTGSTKSEQQNFWKIGAQVNLYRGGRDRLEDRLRESLASGGRMESAREFESQLKEARQMYWRLIAMGKIIDDRGEGLTKNEDNLASARRRAGAGVTSAADAVQFELQKTLLSQELKTLEHEQDVLRSRLSVVLGLDQHENLRVAGDFPHPEPAGADLEKLTPARQPELRGLNEKATAEKLKGDQFARGWRPKLDVYGHYGVPALSDELDRARAQNVEWTAGVRLALDLGQGLEDGRESAARNLEAEALRLRGKYRMREIVAADHELRHELKLLHELIHDADKDIDRAQRFLKLTEGEYNRGVKNGPDLLSAFQRLYEFRRRRTELYRDYHSGRAELSALTAHAD